MSDVFGGSNPYAPTLSPSFGLPQGAEGAEATRNMYLSHEASIKSVGFLYLLGGVFCVLFTLGYIAAGVAMINGNEPNGQGAGAALIVLGIVVGGLGVLQFFTGLGLRKLTPWTRIAAIVFSAIGLIGFPIGTIISGYILYLMVSEKGQFVFSPAYADVIKQTPHIKYKTSIVVWIFLGLLVVLITIGVIAVVIASATR